MEPGNGTVEGFNASRHTMFKRSTKLGFAMPTPDERTSQGSTLPALIATISLVLSIAAVLTAVTMNAARAAHLF